MDTDEGKAALEREHPGWAIWAGVNGRCYASRRFGITNVTLRAHNWTALGQKIRKAGASLARRP